MVRLLVIMSIVLVIIIGGAVFMSSAGAEEIPDYTVVSSDGDIEIRDYPPQLIAEVTVSGDRNTAGRRAFDKLGGFIFGENTSRSKVAMTAPVTQTPISEKIAMTAPVTQTPVETASSPAEAETWIVNFMMPSKYTMDTLPVPTDSTIRIKQTEPYRAVTLRFSGRANVAQMAQMTEKLESYMAANELTPVGPPDYAFYNAPWVPGPLRRNEVHYRLAD